MRRHQKKAFTSRWHPYYAPVVTRRFRTQAMSSHA
jgi:hypothetical protein